MDTEQFDMSNWTEPIHEAIDKMTGFHKNPQDWEPFITNFFDQLLERSVELAPDEGRPYFEYLLSYENMLQKVREYIDNRC